MEAGRIGGGEQGGYIAGGTRNEGNLDSPFPFPQRGTPGRAGSPHAAKNGGSPRKRASPLARSPQKDALKTLIDKGRPSHGRLI
jgi:hypothetical protein